MRRKAGRRYAQITPQEAAAQPYLLISISMTGQGPREIYDWAPDGPDMIHDQTIKLELRA